MEELLSAGVHPGALGRREGQWIWQGAGSMGRGGVQHRQASYQLQVWLFLGAILILITFSVACDFV